MLQKVREGKGVDVGDFQDSEVFLRRTLKMGKICTLNRR